VFEKPSLKIETQLMATTSTQPTIPTKKRTSTIFVAKTSNEWNIAKHRNPVLSADSQD